MKSIIRRGVFETNSSSTHSLSVVSKEEFAAWERGELLYNDWTGELVSAEAKTIAEDEAKDDDDDDDDKKLYTHEQFFNRADYETFDLERTVNGVKIVAFGYYGANT